MFEIAGTSESAALGPCGAKGDDLGALLVLAVVPSRSNAETVPGSRPSSGLRLLTLRAATRSPTGDRSMPPILMYDQG